jgi:hypothetical protein
MAEDWKSLGSMDHEISSGSAPVTLQSKKTELQGRIDAWLNFRHERGGENWLGKKGKIKRLMSKTDAGRRFFMLVYGDNLLGSFSISEQGIEAEGRVWDRVRKALIGGDFDKAIEKQIGIQAAKAKAMQAKRKK